MSYNWKPTITWSAFLLQYHEIEIKWQIQNSEKYRKPIIERRLAMFPTNYSPYDGLSKVFLVLIVIGALAALAFTNSDLTNFITNSAKAEGIKQELAIQNLKSI